VSFFTTKTALSFVAFGSVCCVLAAYGCVAEVADAEAVGIAAAGFDVVELSATV
jgi:hypothetical protein